MENIKTKRDVLVIKIINFLMFFFVFACIFLPAGTYNIKDISLLLIVGITFLYKPKHLKISRFELVFSLIMPLSFIMLSLFTNSQDFIGVILRGITGVLLILHVSVRKFDIDFMKITINILKGLSIFICIIVLLDALKAVDLLENPIVIWLNNSNNAMIGKESEGFIFTYLIFMKSSPLMLILLMHSLKSKKYFWCSIALISLFLSGTRANVFIAILLCFTYVTFLMKGKGIKYLITAVAVILIIFFSLEIIELIATAFETKSSSDHVRNGHLESIIRLFKNSNIFLFGQGLNSYFYSTGTNGYVNLVELSYWDLLRQVGIFGFMLFTTFLAGLCRMIVTKKNSKWLLMAYLGYLAIAYTNPLLYSSTGYILYIFILSYNQYEKGDCQNERYYFSGR